MKSGPLRGIRGVCHILSSRMINHNAVLKNDSVPLEVLEDIVEDYISETLASS